MTHRIDYDDHWDNKGCLSSMWKGMAALVALSIGLLFSTADCDTKPGKRPWLNAASTSSMSVPTYAGYLGTIPQWLE